MSDFYRITLNSNCTHVVSQQFVAMKAYNDTVEAHAADRNLRIFHQDQQGTELWETVFVNGDVILMRHIE